ncbi:hypothetical protein OF83DRAFT_838988 [Amylostereum chailletii]|nr:hypothetical protein OF83DRAFT_838988 [Amylostereum chailletii]
MVNERTCRLIRSKPISLALCALVVVTSHPSSAVVRQLPAAGTKVAIRWQCPHRRTLQIDHVWAKNLMFPTKTQDLIDEPHSERAANVWLSLTSDTPTRSTATASKYGRARWAIARAFHNHIGTPSSRPSAHGHTRPAGPARLFPLSRSSLQH